MKIPIFYNPKQSMKHMVHPVTSTWTKAIHTPDLVIQQIQEQISDQIEIKSNWTPLTVDEIAVAHDKQHVLDILEGRKPNGWGVISPESRQALPWESASFFHAALHAVQSHSIAMSPTGAFHHAEYDQVDGYCTFNGLMIAAILLKQFGFVKKVGILDMDAHYPNGTVNIMQVLKTDFIAQINWATEFKLLHGRSIGSWLNKEFYTLLQDRFSDADVLFYQAGADAHISDQSSTSTMTTGILEWRDFMVFQFAHEHHIPIVWNLAGGHVMDQELILKIHTSTFRQALAVHTLEHKLLKPPRMLS